MAADPTGGRCGDRLTNPVDYAGTLAELRARGVEFVGEPFVVEEINRNLAVVKDNSGNLIELSAPRS